MKKILLILIIGILLANCADKKTEPKTELKNETETAEVVQTVESVINNIGETEIGTLNIVDTYQELLLKQKGNKCGEWGGDTEEIRIYKTAYKGKTFADYKKIIIDCKDPYSQKTKPEIIENKSIVLNEKELLLVEKSILELIDFKLKTAKQISHSGIGNSVISRDSTLIIEHWPSFGWPKFRELIKQIENK